MFIDGATLLDSPGFPGCDIVEAHALADAAVGAIEAEVGPVVSTEATLEMQGNWTNRIHVIRRPLTDVSAVSIDGDTIGVTDLTVFRTGKIVRKCGRTWGGPDVPVSITCTAGYPSDAVPRWLIDMAIAAAKRSATNPEAVAQETIGSYSVSYGSTSATVALRKNDRHTLRSRYGLGIGYL